MNHSAQVRLRVESSLGAHHASALTPRLRAAPELISCGERELDEILHGGLRVGAITEFVGPECSGRTTLALAYVSAITREGKVGAWIDVADALDPETAAANGVDLEKLLWVRCGAQQNTAAEAGEIRQAASPLTSSPAQARHTGGGSPHPRSEGRDMPEAVGALLHAHGGLYDRQLRREKKTRRTGNAPNRPFPYRSEDREEQVNSDRLPARRGSNLAPVPHALAYGVSPSIAEPQPAPASNTFQCEFLPHFPQRMPDDTLKTHHVAAKPWQALDQALQVADLLLQSGGFTVIVLDLGSTPPEKAWRIPLASWFRFRAACERTRVSLLLLTQHSCARSSAELVVRLRSGNMETQSKVMTGVRYYSASERIRGAECHEQRVVPIRKQPQPERAVRETRGQWKREASWAQSP